MAGSSPGPTDLVGRVKSGPRDFWLAGSSPAQGDRPGVARILVTGAGGFIGAALCPALAARGHAVAAGLRRGGAAPPRARPLVLGDIGAATDWAPPLAGVDVVIHLAQRAHAGPDPAALAGELGASGARRLVLVSSVKAMGEATAPGRPLRAGDAPAPQDAYGRAKLAGEDAARTAAREAGIELVVVRPP